MNAIIREFGKCVAFFINRRSIFYVTCFMWFVSPYFCTVGTAEVVTTSSRTTSSLEHEKTQGLVYQDTENKLCA